MDEIKTKQLMETIDNYNVQVVNIKNTSNSHINERIEKIFVINLKPDTIKRNYIITLFKKYGINFTLVVVDYIPNNIYNKLCSDEEISRNELGCCISHLWCLKQIIINKCKNVIIFEDDIILHKEFVSKFIKIYDINKSIDFMLLGSHDYKFASSHYLNVKKSLYKPGNETTNLYGAHANYYSLNGAKRQFLIRTTQIAFFDKEYLLMFNHFPKSYICYPNLVVANITSSSLNHSREILSDLELEYYKKCFINFNFEKYNFVYLNILENTHVHLNKTDTYENFTDKYLYKYFYDFEKIEKIKKRLVMNFFTIEEIKNIINI